MVTRTESPRFEARFALRLYGILGIALGVVALRHFLVQDLPPASGVFGGTIASALIGILGVGAFLLVRWMSLSFAILSFGFGLVLLNALRYSQAGDVLGWSPSLSPLRLSLPSWFGVAGQHSVEHSAAL
jgi:hypothetical protein